MFYLISKDNLKLIIIKQSTTKFYFDKSFYKYKLIYKKQCMQLKRILIYYFDYVNKIYYDTLDMIWLKYIFDNGKLNKSK